LGAFAAVTAALLAADVLRVVLARLLPGVFGKVLLGYGLALAAGGGVVFRPLTRGWGRTPATSTGAPRWPLTGSGPG
jgi:hypothetical protein